VTVSRLPPVSFYRDLQHKTFSIEVFFHATKTR